MIIIRRLGIGDMKRAIGLKGLCWPEEIAGLSQNKFDYEREYEFWTGWMGAGEENDDVRLLYGAFEDNEMLGVAFGSFVESKSRPEEGIELNGLWVYPEHRGRGVSLMLLNKLLGEFYELGARKMIVYNYHYSKSNSYYRKLGCHVVDTEYQLEERVPTDIFVNSIADMQDRIELSLERFKTTV